MADLVGTLSLLQTLMAFSPQTIDVEYHIETPAGGTTTLNIKTSACPTPKTVSKTDAAKLAGKHSAMLMLLGTILAAPPPPPSEYRKRGDGVQINSSGGE